MSGQIMSALMPRVNELAGQLGRYLLVVKGTAADGVTPAGADVPLSTIEGVTQHIAYKQNDGVTIRDTRDPGTFNVVADGAIAKGASIYSAAGGKVSATGTTNVIGRAMSEATVDGGIIEAFLK